MMIEDLAFAFKTFRRNKTRTILSLLGIIIGVASVIVITSIGESAQRNVTAAFGSSGLNLVRLQAGWRLRSANISFNDAFSAKLFDEIPHLKRIWPVNSVNATLRNNDSDVNAAGSAVEYGYLEMCGLELDYGSFFSVSDDVKGVQAAVLQSDAAKSLFPEGGAAGKHIVLIYQGQSFSFKVIGVLAETNGGFETSSVYVPRGFYTKKIEPSPAASSLVLEADNQNHAVAVTDAARAYIASLTGDEYSVNIVSMKSALSQFEAVSGTMNLLLSGIAAISLLVGGVGIMNIMIVTVTERKKEIGIRKAIGASGAAIRTQFLVEAAAITLTGGIAGIAAGILISLCAVYVMNWPFVVNPAACLAAFLFSAFIGVFFGFNPASRAAKLDPVDALQSQ
ncbi:MAG: ABC transporter permease [Spirochaetaceae bacterium]|jgi:putative ABC transport system permease protein|nr:ABC transporter permease [Spirochaetaceae bacterium]